MAKLEIQTKRLLLKKPMNIDKPMLIHNLNSWDLVKWLSYVPYPYSSKDADTWINDIVKKDKYNFNIYLNNKLIGGMGLTRAKDYKFEFGYWLGMEYWGNGYATEAGVALFNKASDLNPNNFIATYMKENLASGRVLEKLGFYNVSESLKYSLSRKEKIPVMIMGHD